MTMRYPARRRCRGRLRAVAETHQPVGRAREVGGIEVQNRSKGRSRAVAGAQDPAWPCTRAIGSSPSFSRRIARRTRPPGSVEQRRALVTPPDAAPFLRRQDQRRRSSSPQGRAAPAERLHVEGRILAHLRCTAAGVAERSAARHEDARRGCQLAARAAREISSNDRVLRGTGEQPRAGARPYDQKRATSARGVAHAYRGSFVRRV